MPPVFDRRVRCAAFVRVTLCIFMPVNLQLGLCARHRQGCVPAFHPPQKKSLWVIRFNDSRVILPVFTTNLKGYYDLEGLDYYLSHNHVQLVVVIHNKAIIKAFS